MEAPPLPHQAGLQKPSQVSQRKGLSRLGQEALLHHQGGLQKLCPNQAAGEDFSRLLAQPDDVDGRCWLSTLLGFFVVFCFRLFTFQK